MRSGFANSESPRNMKLSKTGFVSLVGLFSSAICGAGFDVMSCDSSFGMAVGWTSCVEDCAYKLCAAQMPMMPRIVISAGMYRFKVRSLFSFSVYSAVVFCAYLRIALSKNLLIRPCFWWVGGYCFIFIGHGGTKERPLSCERGVFCFNRC